MNPAPSHLFRLPNGMEIHSLNEPETVFASEEIFADRIYLRHGVVLPPDACVFDVGANVGLFTTFVKTEAPDSRVLCFEPSPVLYELLVRNTERFGASVTALPVGLGDQDGEAPFTYYPGYSILSGFHADPAEDERLLAAGIRRQLVERYGDADRAEQAVAAMARARLRNAVHATCRLRRVSTVMREEGIARIDLLKVDVEKSELEVLRGIEAADWPRIRQVVGEIHDPEGGRVETIRALLGGHGFTVHVDQAADGIFNFYALRDPEGAAPAP
jgi:FkbM family methyltransferase